MRLAQHMETMKFTTFFTMILVGFLSCTPSKSNGKNHRIILRPDIKKKEIPNDTIRVKGKAFVFFTLSQIEYERFTKDANSGIDEVLSDFNYYAEAIADTINKHDYKPIKTTCRYIQVIFDNNTTKTFDRLLDKKNKTGYILTNGKKEPQIDFGVFSDIDFLIIFKEYWEN
ncbi:MAG: hypothetical protein NTZ69_14045 [Bacteroidia bacterium]|nr:hypothetical protein [Bacteroidia bacterium]